MAQYGSQDADAVADRVQVRFSAPAGQLETGNLCDAQTRLHGPHRHLGLDFEAGRRQVQVLEIATVERAESVTEVGQVAVVQRVEHPEQEPVAEPPEPGDVQRRSAADEPRPFDEVVAVGKEMHIVGDLAAGDMLPSASIMTMMSPVAARKPVRNALPLPVPCCGTTRTSGRHRRAVTSVTSVESPSTRMISSTSSAICSSTQPMLRASFLTGITRLTVGSALVDGLWRERESRASGCSVVPVGSAGCSADTPYPNSVEFEDETLVMFRLPIRR